MSGRTGNEATKTSVPATTESVDATVACWGSLLESPSRGVGWPAPWDAERVRGGVGAACLHSPAATMAQIDDVLFGKGKREQFYKMKDPSEVRAHCCGLGALSLATLLGAATAADECRRALRQSTAGSRQPARRQQRQLCGWPTPACERWCWRSWDGWAAAARPTAAAAGLGRAGQGGRASTRVGDHTLARHGCGLHCADALAAWHCPPAHWLANHMPPRALRSSRLVSPGARPSRS